MKRDEKKCKPIRQQINGVMEQEHAGTVSFELIIIMCLFAVLMFTIISVPIIEYDTPGVSHADQGWNRMSFVELIEYKVGELRDYITNNGDNTGVWFN